MDSAGLNSRREFLAAAAGAAGLAAGILGAVPAPARAEEAKPSFTTKPKKALIRGRPVEEELKKLKEAGFDGIEAVIDGKNGPSRAEAEKGREVCDRLGMRVHSVLRGWAEFNSPDPAKVEETVKITEAALEGAAGYGADTVLLVPCRIGGMRMPRPWEFLIEFDPANGHIVKLTAGDQSPFEEYIRAHNHAIDTSREAVKRLAPVAEKAGVVIALENVWNNLWPRPAVFKHFVESFGTPWVRAYYDIGNHVKYSPPEEWILTLGNLIVKMHVKDFKLNPADPGGGGDFVGIRDGSVRWPILRQALERIGYNGWMTVEDEKFPIPEVSRRFDLILAGT